MQKSNNNNNNYKGNGLNNEQQNNNNNNNNNNDIWGAPVPLGASQEVWKGSSNAPTMVDTYGLSDISGPQPMMAKQQQTSIHQQTVIMPNSAFNGLDNTPLSFNEPMGGNSKKAQIVVLPNIDDNLNILAEFKSEPSFFVPSKCIGLNGGGLQATPAMYNEMTSVVVDETPKQVLSKFEAILSSFSNDIDYQIDEANYIISGQIFIRHFAVFFKISIWEEQEVNNNRTRFEFRRSKGDTVAFTEFWNEIEDILYKQFTNCQGMRNMNDDDDMMNNNNDFGGGFDGGLGGGFGGGFGSLGGLPPLDYNFNLDLDDDQEDDQQQQQQQQGLTKQDLDNFVYDIDQCDPSVVYSLAMLLDAFKIQTHFIQMVFNHTQFIKCIIESALTHQDTALVRGALITLERLCSSSSGSDDLIKLGVLDAVVPLLQHKCDLIRKYSVRVLSKLASAKSWRFSNQKLRKFASISVKECQLKWGNLQFATNDFIQQQMFENINNKLISVQ